MAPGWAIRARSTLLPATLVSATLALAMLWPFCLSGCGGRSAPEMSATIAPHMDRFESFERWARRFGLADSIFGPQEALEEAIFAPVRRVDGVEAAWVSREGPDSIHLSHPAGTPPPPQEEWIRLRVAGERIEARFSILDSREGENRVILIRRIRPAPDGGSLQVTMAFRSADPPASPER